MVFITTVDVTDEMSAVNKYYVSMAMAFKIFCHILPLGGAIEKAVLSINAIYIYLLKNNIGGIHIFV